MQISIGDSGAITCLFSEPSDPSKSWKPSLHFHGFHFHFLLSFGLTWENLKKCGSYREPLLPWRPEAVPNMHFLGFPLGPQNSTKIKNGNHGNEERASSSYLNLTTQKMDGWWLCNLRLKYALQFSQNALQGLVNGKWVGFLLFTLVFIKDFRVLYYF